MRSDELGRYEAASTEAEVSFGRSRLTEEPVQITSEGYTAGIDMAGVCEGIPGVSGSSATYSFVAPSTDLVYEATNTGIKETLVLDSPSAPSAFTFTIDSGGLTVRRDFGSSWGLYSDESTEAVFTIGALTVFDSTESTTGEPAYCEGARMQVTPTETGAVVTYTIPEEWMNDPARVFPVMVDPSLNTVASDDTFVSSAAPTTVYGSSEALACGYYDAAAGHRRSYVRFSLESIPAWARVDSATLSLYQYYTYYTNTATTTYLALPTAAWTESTTWSSKPAQTAMIASQSVTGRGVWVNWSQAAVKSAAASWVANPTGNKGFVCYQDEGGSQNTTHYRWFCSSEYSDTSLRPKLVVTYTTIPDAVTDVSASTADSFGWFREVDRNGDLISDTPNDVGTDGRGAVSLDWTATARAAGYIIYAYDGDSYNQVGKVFGHDTTTWTSEGAGLYPSDSTIAGWTQDARDAFASASSPSAATQVDSFSSPVSGSSGVIVTDGTYLYVRGWGSGTGIPTSWRKVGTGLNGTVEGQDYGQVGKDFTTSGWIYSAFYLDGVIYNGRTVTSTTLAGVPKSAKAGETTTVTLTFSQPLLKRSDASVAGANSGEVLLASDGERIYNVCHDVPGGASYDRWTIRVYDRSGTWLCDRTVTAPYYYQNTLYGSYYTCGVLADGENLYLVKWTGSDYAKITKIRTDDFTIQNQWSIDQSATKAVNGCYAAATNSFFLGSRYDSGIYRYSGTGLELRDNPEALYEKGTNAAYHDSGNYWFRVVPYNALNENAVFGDCAYYAPTLENRTVSVNDEDRDTVSEIGGIAGHSMSAVLDETALDVSVTDLEIASFGPAAAVSRSYSSARTTANLFTSAPGWRFSFEKSAASVTGGVAVTDESGSTDTFVLQGGVYSAPNGCYDTLTSSGGNWIVIHKDRSRDVYSQSTGKILASYDKVSNAVTYTWGTNALTITAANGQTIQVSFNTSGKVTGAVYATSSGTRTVTYSTGTSPSVTCFDGDADCEYVVQYTYTSSRLTSIAVPGYPVDGQNASWLFTYSSGRLASAKSPTQSDAQKTLYGYTWTPSTTDDTSTQAATSGTWVACSDFPSCYGSTYRYSSAANASATFTFTGTAASFISIKGPSYGKASIYVDGTYQSTVDLYASSYSYQQSVYSKTGLTDGVHTLQVVVTGTKNASSSGVTVIVDAFTSTSAAPDAATVTSRADVGSANSALVAKDAAVDVHYTINPTGTMASMTDPHTQSADHATWTYAYAPVNEAVVELAPSGTSMSRTFDSRGNMTATFDEEGHRTTFVYDALDQVIRWSDVRGRTTYYTYSDDCYGGSGLPVACETQLNATERSRAVTEWDSVGRIVSIQEWLSANAWATTEYTYGALFEDPVTATQVHVALGDGTTPDLVTTSVYDGFGNLTSTTNPEGEVTSSEYNLAGQVTVSTDSAGTEEHSSYDLLGHATRTWHEAEGEICDLVKAEYNADGSVALRACMLVNGSTETTAEVVHYAYDASGLEISVDNDAVVGSAVVHRDASQRIVAEWAEGAAVAPLSAAGRYVYDDDGNLIQAYGPGCASPVVYVYDADGFVATLTDADGVWSSYTYDAGGLCLSATKPTNDGGTVTTSNSYDVGGRLVKTSSTTGSSTLFSYDFLGQQTSAAAEGHEGSEIIWNGAGWIVSTIDADGMTTSNEYDAAGRLVATTSIDGTTLSSYDASGRLVETEDADGATIEYTFDGFSRVETVTQKSAASAVIKSSEFVYDSTSRLTGGIVTDAVAGVSRNVDTTYSNTYIADTYTVDTVMGSVSTTRSLDAAGCELSRSSSTDAGILQRDIGDRDDFGQVSESVFRGIHSFRTYSDAGNLLTQQGEGFGSSGAVYTFDAAGELVAETIDLDYAGADTESDSYSYDDTGRVVSAEVAGLGTEYAYAAGSGNLTAIKRSGESTTSFAYDEANRVITSSGANQPTVTYGWDVTTGRRTSKTVEGFEAVVFEYSDAGRLLAYADPNRNISISYTYDATGQRTGAHVTEGSIETSYTYNYDGLALLGVEAHGSAEPWSLSYLYGDDGLYGGVFVSSETSTTQAVSFGVVRTGRGDVRELTDAEGVPFALYTYDAYGRALDATSTATSLIDSTTASRIAEANVLRYAGCAYDDLSELYYMSQRYYDPCTGSFISKDPARSDGEESAYQYCAGDPVNNTDPTGLWKDSWHHDMTRSVAWDEGSCGWSTTYANVVADGDKYVDAWNGFSSLRYSQSSVEYGYHFNNTPLSGITIWTFGADESVYASRQVQFGDSRYTRIVGNVRTAKLHAEYAMAYGVTSAKGVAYCTNAATRMGYAAHAMQDGWAHGNMQSHAGRGCFDEVTWKPERELSARQGTLAMFTQYSFEWIFME